MTKSFLTGILITFCFLILETAIISNLGLLPAAPDFLLIITLYLAIRNGNLSGEVNGFASGLMLDFMTAAPLGFNSLLRTCLGFVFGFFHNVLNVTSFALQFAYGAAATIIKAIFIFLISIFFKGIQPYPIFSLIFLTELILNTIFTPLMFLFLNLFSDFLLLKPEKNL
ncbi:MAG: rod shape-determining protein MreD [Treponemataceae bacterium]|nr:rod shape-determining protein MreD [Treponemataceae bacterium]